MKADSLEELQKIYTDVSEWLKYAETKHAGLFAVWTAFLIAMLSIDEFYKISITLRIAALIIVCIGMGIDLLSFLPFTNRVDFLRKRCYKKYSSYHGNVVFYQTIYVDTFCTKEEKNSENSVSKYKKILEGKKLQGLDEPLIQDYMQQIIEVSAVGIIKIYLFNIAIKYAFGVILIMLIILVCM